MAGLNYPISADVSKFESAMTKMRDTVVAHSATMVQRFVAVTGAIDGTTRVASRMPELLRGVATGFLALAAAKLTMDAIGAATRAAAEQVEHLAEIGRRAASLNVSTSFLQTMRSQANALGIEAKELEMILERVRDVSIVKQGSGGADARNESELEGRLRRQAELGNVRPGDVTAFANAADTEARFKSLLELMQRLIAEGRTLAALDIGSKFLDPATLDRVRQNRAELDKIIEVTKTIKPAEIFSQADIDRSQDLSRRLTEARDTLETGLKPIYADLTLASHRFHESNVQWVEFMARQIPRLVGLYQELQGAIRGAAKGADGLTQQERAGAAAGNVIGALAGGKPIPPALAGDADMAAARDVYTRNMNRFSIARQQREGQAIAEATSERLRGGDRTAPDTGRAKAAGASPTESLDEIERYINAIQRTGEVLKAEFEALGKSNVEREKGIALAKLDAAARSAGRTVTEEERARVVALAEANARLNDRLADQRQKLAENAELMRTLGQAGADAFAGMILEGRTLDETLGNLAKSLARMAIQAAFTGGGPLAGILGLSAPASAGPNASGGLIGLIGNLLPGRASGGPVTAGQPYIIGERGPEIMVPNVGGTVIPNYAMPGPGTMAPRGGSNVTINMGGPTIHAPNSSLGPAELGAILAANNRKQSEELSYRIRELIQRSRI